MPLGLKRCGSKVHRQDGSKQWTMKSLAGQASPYRIRDSISLWCPLKPVQPVVLGQGWVTSRLCLRRQTLKKSSSCCLKAPRDRGCQSLWHGASQEVSPKVRSPCPPSGAGHCFNKSEGEAQGSCSWGLMEGSSPAIIPRHDRNDCTRVWHCVPSFTLRQMAELELILPHRLGWRKLMTWGHVLLLQVACALCVSIKVDYGGVTVSLQGL